MQDSIDAGRAHEDGPSRNRLQTVTLLDALREGRFDAAFGGARRDEERARAKERVLSFRDELGQWEPRNQRPEVWDLFNTVVRRGESVRAFPISNWTELDVWRYIEAEELEVPSIYYAHEREVFERDGMLFAVSELHAAQRREGVHRARALPHRGRPDGDRRGALGRRRHRRDPRRDRRLAHDRARRHAGRRPDVLRRHGRPQARGLFLVPDLLRIATAGSVDDGKSTLIGRLLLDSKQLLDDQGEDDLAHVTDGLRAEREQGITIDVAYRFFATPRRSFILADTPGHVRYTRNMVTGASTADLALVLIDARKGLLEQSRRHAYLAALLGIRHLVACVNKMDLVDFDEERFREIEARVRRARRAARDRRRARGADLGAARATTSSTPSPRLAWYDAPPLLEQLETRRGRPRPQPRRRALPRAVDGPRGRLPRLRGAGRRRRAGGRRRGRRAAVGLALADRGDRHAAAGRCERAVAADGGDAAARRTSSTSAAATSSSAPGDEPEVARELDATVCWMVEAPARVGARYLLKHTTRRVRANIAEISARRGHRRPSRRRRPTSSASTTSGASSCAPRRRCWPTRTPPTARRARSS